MQGKKRFSIGMNPILLGLCDGLAEYFSINVWFVRVLLFTALYLITGSLVINFFLYVLIAFLMPQQNRAKSDIDEFQAKN